MGLCQPNYGEDMGTFPEKPEESGVSGWVSSTLSPFECPGASPVRTYHFSYFFLWVF